MKTNKLIAAIMIVFALAWLGCDKKKEAEAEETPMSVRFGKVTQGEITRTLDLVCNVNADRMSVLMSNVPGKIRKIYHRDGDSVPEAEPLIEIDPEEVELGVQQAGAGLSAAQATAAQAQVQRDVMRNEFERISALRDRDAISQSDYDRAEAAYRAAEQAVVMAEANIDNASALVGRADIYNRDTVVRAPFAGHIAKLLVEEGDRILTMPPTALLAIIDYDRVKVECPVAERDVGSVNEGMAISIRFDAFPNATVEAAIDRVVPYLEPESRTFTVQSYIDNMEHRYKPGMMARVAVVATYPDVVTVERDAFSLNNVTGDIRIVEVVDGVARERMARPGRSFGDRVEIVDMAGLSDGSVVITSGASDILEGQRVKLVEEAAGTDILLDQTGDATPETTVDPGPETTPEVEPDDAGEPEEKLDDDETGDSETELEDDEEYLESETEMDEIDEMDEESPSTQDDFDSEENR